MLLAAPGLVLVVAGILLVVGLAREPHRTPKAVPARLAGAVCMVVGVISLAFAQ
jgi:hypothetical protein